MDKNNSNDSDSRVANIKDMSATITRAILKKIYCMHKGSPYGESESNEISTNVFKSIRANNSCIEACTNYIIDKIKYSSTINADPCFIRDIISIEDEPKMANVFYDYIVNKYRCYRMLNWANHGLISRNYNGEIDYNNIMPITFTLYAPYSVCLVSCLHDIYAKVSNYRYRAVISIIAPELHSFLTNNVVMYDADEDSTAPVARNSVDVCIRSNKIKISSPKFYIINAGGSFNTFKDVFNAYGIPFLDSTLGLYVTIAHKFINKFGCNIHDYLGEKLNMYFRKVGLTMDNQQTLKDLLNEIIDELDNYYIIDKRKADVSVKVRSTNEEVNDLTTVNTYIGDIIVNKVAKDDFKNIELNVSDDDESDVIVEECVQEETTDNTVENEVAEQPVRQIRKRVVVENGMLRIIEEEV